MHRRAKKNEKPATEHPKLVMHPFDECHGLATMETGQATLVAQPTTFDNKKANDVRARLEMHIIKILDDITKARLGKALRRVEQEFEIIKEEANNRKGTTKKVCMENAYIPSLFFQFYTSPLCVDYINTILGYLATQQLISIEGPEVHSINSNRYSSQIGHLYALLLSYSRQHAGMDDNAFFETLYRFAWRLVEKAFPDEELHVQAEFDRICKVGSSSEPSVAKPSYNVIKKTHTLEKVNQRSHIIDILLPPVHSLATPAPPPVIVPAPQQSHQLASIINCRIYDPHFTRSGQEVGNSRDLKAPRIREKKAHLREVHAFDIKHLLHASIQTSDRGS